MTRYVTDVLHPQFKMLCYFSDRHLSSCIRVPQEIVSNFLRATMTIGLPERAVKIAQWQLVSCRERVVSFPPSAVICSQAVHY
jgi:hypothetical protein